MAPSGNPLYAEVANLKTRMGVVEKRVDGHDKAIREMNLDMSLLADIVLRSHARAAAVRLARRRRARTR